MTAVEHRPELPADWMQQANCTGVDTRLFFPERGNNFDVREARAVCAGCVVREECLEYALANGEKFGVWGGTSERERRRIRRSRHLSKPKPVAPCGTDAGYRNHQRKHTPACVACQLAHRQAVALSKARVGA